MPPAIRLSDTGSLTVRKRSGSENFRPDIVNDEKFTLEDQDLAVRVKVTEAAGHTPGSVSVIADNASAMTGNTLIW